MLFHLPQIIKTKFVFSICIACFLIFSFSLSAQTDKECLYFEFETVGMTSCGKNAPFWHTSNHQGLPSIKSNNGYAHFSAIGREPLICGSHINYGADFGLGAGVENEMFVHQLYADLGYKWVGLSLGMKERKSDKNISLSSGALTWSGNSSPIPEIRAGIPQYVMIPVFGNWLSIKGHVGYGRLTDDKWRKEHGVSKYTENILFHSKSLFLRFGNDDKLPFQITMGLEMNNMFGGVRHSEGSEHFKPSDVSTYWTVLFPFHRVEQQGDDDGDNLGSWHLNFDYKLKDWHIGAYYEHFYEDHSAMLGIEYKNNTIGEKGFVFYGFRRNWFDGLFGIEVNAPKGVKFFRNAVFEFMNTRGQSGSVCHSIANNTEGMIVIEEVDGRDAMYNHSFYDSYTHHGYAIGNPVLISPAYNDDGSTLFRSNRVQMLHLGIDGELSSCIVYRLLATTTRHWGQYGNPLKEEERITSFMLECSYKMDDEYGWMISLSGAADFDSGSDGSYLLGNNKGVMVTVSKTWKVR